MIELQPKPQFSVVVPPKTLQEGYLVHFSGDWPSTFTQIREKTFRVMATNQVPYDLSYIIPAADYRDVDFSNGTGTYQESIYPEKYESLFEVLVGFKPGNFISHWMIPASRYLSRLEYAEMYPDLSNAKRLYLGARQPKDSPYDDPRIKIYLVNDLEPLIMRLYCLTGVDYEHITVGLTINKCLMEEVQQPSQDELLKAKVIRYYDYLKW